MKKLTGQQLAIGTVILVAVLGYFMWKNSQESIPEGFYTGNGRIEATEIDIATKLAGRIEDIFVDEADFVSKGQPLAVMQTDVLKAQFFEAQAQMHSAIAAAARAKANITLRESDRDASIAIVAQRESELDAGQRRLNRSSKLSRTGAMSIQQFDDDETRVTGAKAAVATAKAQVTVAEAAVQAAIADLAGAEANVKAAEATVERIKADITDSTLVAPCDGRIQYRIAEPGEVLPAGGKVLNLVDLSDVYMTFFLPSAEAGRIGMGTEARIVLDTAPEYPIPAEISFVSSVAQFTPKTVETQAEREKLMFRVKAQISKQLLKNYIQYVKTGLPGVTWVKASPDAQWPASLTLNTNINDNAFSKESAASRAQNDPQGKARPGTGAGMPGASIDAPAEQKTAAEQTFTDGPVAGAETHPEKDSSTTSETGNGGLKADSGPDSKSDNKPETGKSGPLEPKARESEENNATFPIPSRPDTPQTGTPQTGASQPDTLQPARSQQDTPQPAAGNPPANSVTTPPTMNRQQ